MLSSKCGPIGAVGSKVNKLETGVSYPGGRVTCKCFI